MNRAADHRGRCCRDDRLNRRFDWSERALEGADISESVTR